MIDDAEPCEFYQRRVITSRKAYKCCECGREISKGEKYQNASMKAEGRFYIYKTCIHCHTASLWLEEVCGGYLHEGLIEELEEHLSEYNYEGEKMRMMFVARCLVGIKMDWKAFKKAGLLPLPKLKLPIPALEKVPA